MEIKLLRPQVIAEWINDRLKDKPMESKNILVDLTGKTHVVGIPLPKYSGAEIRSLKLQQESRLIPLG
jgi:hypothetical protein